MPKSLFDLSEADLAGKAKVPAVLLGCQLGHAGDLLTAGITDTIPVLFHS